MYTYKDFDNTPEGITRAVDAWLSSLRRNQMLIAASYYRGDNVTIREIRKTVVLRSEEGAYYEADNPYVSNHKVADSFFAEVVDQKVSTLLSQPPQFAGAPDSAVAALQPALVALEELGTEAAVKGVGYAVVTEAAPQLTLSVLDAEDCVAFVTDAGDLFALIRFWNETYMFGQRSRQRADVYEASGVTSYEREDGAGVFQLVAVTPHRYSATRSAVENTTTPLQWAAGLPVLMLRNDKYGNSDFSPALRAQTDVIDIVSSDFANNLSDFQDVFWIIKGLDDSTADEMGRFMETIKNTYKAALPEGADVDTRQVEIPHAARVAFVDMIRKRRIANAGILDTEATLAGSLTATAIMLASAALRRRVGKFSNRVHPVVMRLLQFAAELTGDALTTDTEVRFDAYYLGNDAEVINNLTLSQGQISQRTYLERHPYVKDVEEELQRLEEESATRFAVSDPEPIEEPEEVIDDGQGAPGNG